MQATELSPGLTSVMAEAPKDISNWGRGTQSPCSAFLGAYLVVGVLADIYPAAIMGGLKNQDGRRRNTVQD